MVLSWSLKRKLCLSSHRWIFIKELLDNSQIMDSFDVYEILEELFEVLDIDFENKSEISFNDIIS